ncbi:hypothetical protein PIB30_100503 [Stylosanthes scabra]|uniref:Uncharacterized protein n=1 Tax=Stylosanthes scabra TaxID=79078 RepID=A0ABU6UW31_9FABA|nr:hypothetical protein [Stylosanthes scabra]
MTRTKTTNRYTGAEVNLPSTRSNQTRASREPTPPQEQPSPPPPPTSAKPSSSQGKRPMTEEHAPPPPPPRPRGSGYHSSLHPIVESDEARPPLYKSFYDEYPEESFSKTRFTMLRNYLFWKNNVIDRPLCGSFLADLKHLKLKACICTRTSLCDGFTPTHKSLGPVFAQLHRIITHIILPQSGSYQKVSFCDTLVLFALIMRVKISFAYLMMRHMHDCIKGDRHTALPYGMVLTKVFKAFFVNLDNEPYEERYSHLKGGASSSRSSKAKGSGIKLLVSVVRELIQEVINMASYTSTAMDKSKSRAKVLEKYLNKLEDDHLFSEPEDEEDEDEHLDSLGEDDSDAS